MNADMARGQVAYQAGAAAEQIIAREYERQGYTLACHRWRGASGEIDLIVRNANWVVFIEVKKSRDFGRAAERLSARQMARIYDSASEFLASEPGGQLTDVRFDVALVDASGAFQIIENAFGHG